MEFTTANRIWNRAVQEAGGDSAGPGDRALAAVLLLHGPVMNGGIHHGIDLLDATQLNDAIDGYSYFGFDEAASFLRGASSDPMLMEWTDETEAAAVYLCAELIPDDGRLFDRFEALLRDRPDDFSPMDGSQS